MSPGWTPISPGALPDRLADWLADRSATADANAAHPTDALKVVRVAIDGPACAAPEQLAGLLLEPLRLRGRPVVHIPADTFWRDASLRLEYGREDVESFATWVDADALRREVLDPAAKDGRYLPSLRDPLTNRSTHARAVPIEPDAVLIVSGSLLLGRALPFDRTVHLALSAAARARRTRPELAWTLPAYESYDETVAPVDHADVVIRLDDPRRPAVRGLPT